MDFDDGGFGGGAEDNLSMPLGDFMAFLESEPADDGEDPQPEANQGAPVDKTGFANGFESHEEFLEDEMQANQDSLEVPMDTTGYANGFENHEEFLEDEGFWSHIDPSQYQMEAMVEQGDGTFDDSDAKPYGLVGSDLSGNCRTTNHNNQPLPRDTLNHINAAEEANASPYEVLSNCSYVGEQYFGKAQVKAENHLEGMGPPTNTYLPHNQFPEQSGLSEVKSEDTGAIFDNTGQAGNQFIPMNTFSFDHNAAIPDISYTELNIGEATGSMNNGNSSCLTVQGDYLQAEFGECPKAEYGSLDMAGEMSMHDLPHNNQSYEMEQIPQNICESSSMQTGSPDQYCDDTSLSGYYMSSPDSLSCEQIQSEYIGFKSESSTDSSPIPSSRNSTTEDADKYLGGSTKQLLNSSLVPISHQHPYRSLTDQMPPAFHEQYDIHRSGNSFARGNLSRSCFGANVNGGSDLLNLSSHRAPGHILPPQGIQGKLNNFQQSLSANPFVPRFGGMAYKSHDERATLRLALQDISQPKSEANPPDGLLSVPLLRHQKIALSWMVQKEKNGSHCSGGILADDQGLGKTISTISLILTERSPVPRSTAIKPELCEAVSLDDDEDDPTDLCLKRRSQTCSSEVTTSTTVKTENHIVEIKARPAAGTLVVCPTSVLRQWAEELRNKVTSKANLSFLIYHGSNRTKDPNELTKYDVVLTTYSIVSMEVPKQSSPDSDDEEKGKADRYGAPVSGSKKRKASSSKKTKKATTEKSNLPEKPLARVAWFRVILDEAQTTMLDGKPIISLPPKTISLKAVNFTSEERAFYNTLEAESRAQFKVYAAAGTVRQNYVNILLMLLRLRQACDHPHLVKGHESSWTSSLESANKLPMERKQELLVCLQSCSAICALCNDAPEDAVVTTCGHVFCNQCILEQLTGDDSICPVSNCRVRLNATSLFSRGTLEFSCKSTSEFQSNDSCTEMVHTENQTGIDSSYASSKVRAALDIILSLPKVDPTQSSDSKKTIGLASENTNGMSSEYADTKTTEKAIVFSQWTRMLDLLEVHLKASHVTYRRLDGTMSVAAREKAVNDFKTVPEVSVMIMSLKAASLGLNMVAACHVLMLDLWWNPTTEDQAVDRAHRIGQTRPVTVSRLTVKDTVEDRILALQGPMSLSSRDWSQSHERIGWSTVRTKMYNLSQEKKREMVASAFGEDKSGGASPPEMEHNFAHGMV
ncbi:Putative SWI/SNF-related matrix-associated actin-dependent regulator of chromatin subfamily A member 3-like 2 [Triticum urartu]|uniref:Putative SWI/SNF-related matrix-associated actin-dependent regulator of chromatin subfamily A member 3-like 2 n=1 Tax=Triticum urartu TaxID=4572 RepID=M7Y7P3_TRIUA|nr:Putative SWI/SNF-related matrix-associated actin-dependent regulator of chromatin subfamily A member 3-like 2 [Triticum urartu]